MSHCIESEPESDDELEASVSSENEEDRAFIDDRVEGSPDRSIYMEIIDSTDAAAPPNPKRPKNQRRFDAPLLANLHENTDLQTKRTEDSAKPLKPRTFQFIEEMKERDRKKRIQDNTNSLKKVLDKERTH